MLKKWKWIRLKLSNAASWYFNSGWIESKITLKQNNIETAGIPTEHIAGIPTGLRVKM